MRTLFCVLFLFLVASSAQAGGLYVNESSTSSQSNAGAGRGAWTPDASATLHNPAAMTRLDDHGFASGFSIASGRVRFDPDSGSPSGGDSGGDQAGLAPIASMSYVHKVSDRFRFGLSFYSISGSILDPEDDWAGRFELTSLSLLTISLSPTVAIRVTDWLSIGGGPMATYGRLNWELRTSFGNQEEVELEDFDDWEAAGRVGVLIHPSDDFALSVYYNSETKFNLDGGLNLPGGASTNLDVELPLAQFVEVSAMWRPIERVTLLGTFNWEDWSTADELEVSFTSGVLSGNSTDAITGFRDTYKIAVGANFLVTDDWLFQTGFAYDTSALKDGDRTVALPIDEQWRIGLGLSHQLTDSLNVGLSFVYLNLGTAEVKRPTVRGHYETNEAFIVGLTMAFDELWWSKRLTLGD